MISGGDRSWFIRSNSLNNENLETIPHKEHIATASIRECNRQLVLGKQFKKILMESRFVV